MKFSVITPTHDVQWIKETYQSLKAQTLPDWEWIVVANGDKAAYYHKYLTDLCRDDERVKVHEVRIAGGVGAVKSYAFRLGVGDILVELDHDDMLMPTALETIARAAEQNPRAGFFYSDWADVTGPNAQGDHTYLNPEGRAAWEASGWRFTTTGKFTHPISFEPSAAALSTVLWAPNHVRAWRREVYERLGGHNVGFRVADDHELLVRTYLQSRMHHIPQMLYRYRVSGDNTWLANTAEIGRLSTEVGRTNLEALILREAQLRSLPAFDLGCGDNMRDGWFGVDIDGTKSRGQPTQADLRKRWPWDDNSVMAFRAFDLLEHLPDKLHTMSEIYRCLVPGGWLLSSTPSTDGRGAFMDPTHTSYWNENSFWYWTRQDFNHYIKDHTKARFCEAELYTYHPSSWHRDNKVPYTVANLMVDKPKWKGPRFTQ